MELHPAIVIQGNFSAGGEFDDLKRRRFAHHDRAQLLLLVPFARIVAAGVLIGFVTVGNRHRDHRP